MSFPKPEPRSRVKRRARREAAAVVRDVRAQCVERDGHCRLLRDSFDGGWCYSCVPCESGRASAGPSEWAHLHSHRRSKTRGQAPEDRHTTQGSLMLCRSAHRAYDAHRLEIEPLTDAGCDGPIVARWKD
jgi:hypothetical protein